MFKPLSQKHLPAMRRCCSFRRPLLLTGVLGLSAAVFVVLLQLHVFVKQNHDALERSFRQRKLMSTLSNHDHHPLQQDIQNQPFEWTPHNIGVLIGSCLCALAANSAGIGGGPLFMSLFNVGFGLPVKICVGLSHSVVTVSAMASVLYGLLEPHPKYSNRPLADITIALTFSPPLLLGVSTGVLCVNVTPVWAQTLLLSVLLLFVIVKTFGKAVRQWQAEQKHQRKQLHQQSSAPRNTDQDVEHAEALLSEPEDSVESESSYNLKERPIDAHFAIHEEVFHPRHHKHLVAHKSRFKRSRETLHGAATGLEHALQRIPWGELLQLIVIWAGFVSLQLLKSQWKDGGKQYWLVFAAQAAFLLAASTFYIWRQAQTAKTDPDQLDPELHHMLIGTSSEDLQQSTESQQQQRAVRNLLLIAVVMALAGASAGLLGIGGALIFNPLLLSLGVHPLVVASTAVLIILMSSSSIALSYFFRGDLPLHYAAVLAPACFSSSLLGVILVGRYVRKSGRSSIIIFLLAVLISIGAASLITNQVIQMIQDIR